MRSRLRLPCLMIATLHFALLGACGDKEASMLDVDVVGTENAPFESGVRLSPAGQLVRAAVAAGLVSLDEEGRVVPALAERWIVTDDGLSYIFRLREGTWPDRADITGEMAEQSLRAGVRALSGTAFGQDLAAIREIRAMAGRVVEIRLARPVPDLLQLLAQPELGLFHKHAGSGPMMLTRDGAVAVLAPIAPERLGFASGEGPSAGMRGVRLRSVPATAAVRRFGDGAVDVVLGGRFESFPLGEGAAGLTRRLLRTDPVSGLFGLAFATVSGPLEDPRFREALALAIDREALRGELASGAWAPTTRLAGTGLPGASGPSGERWGDLTVAQRQEAARRLVARWKERRGSFPPLRLALPEGPGADLLFQRLEDDFKAIGVPVTRVSAGTGAELQVLDLVARYNRTEWFLQQFACAVRKPACSAAADALLAEALSSRDPHKRAELLARTEAVMTEANLYIPIGSPVRWSLVRDRVAGFAVNPAGFHPLAPLAKEQN